MGSNVFTMGRHSLETGSLELFAKDLSNRLKVNVEYGTYDSFLFDENGLSHKPTYKKTVLGKVDFFSSEKTLWVEDELYLYHFVYDKYGKDAFKLPFFIKKESNLKDLNDSLNNTSYDIWDIALGDLIGIIYNDTYEYFYSDSFRWFYFCEIFKDAFNDNTLPEQINSFRMDVKSFYEKIEGGEVFYFNDQGSTQYITDFWNDWKNIINEIETNFKDTTLYVSDYMKNKKYPLDDNEYPSAFYDDFKDLK